MLSYIYNCIVIHCSYIHLLILRQETSFVRDTITMTQIEVWQNLICIRLHWRQCKPVSRQGIGAYTLSGSRTDKIISWWRHQMEIFSALLAICAGNSPVTGEFPTQRPVTRSFDVYFDLRPNERLSKQWWGWWFETLSRSLWRHRNVCVSKQHIVLGILDLNNVVLWICSITMLNVHLCYVKTRYTALQWRHNGCDGVWNHQSNDCLLNRLFRRRSKKTSTLRATGLCEGNSPVTGEFPAKRTSTEENASIWWRHHGTPRVLVLPTSR